MKKSILSSLLFMLISSFVIAQYQVDLPKKSHGLGFAAGSTSGYGLSYKYFPEKFGFTVNTVFHIERWDKKLDLGGMFMYRLNEGKYHKLFAYASAYYHYRYDRYLDYGGSYPYNPNWQVSETKRFHTGPGLGVEVFNYRLSFVVHLGMGAYNNFNTFSMLAGGAGLYYRF